MADRVLKIGVFLSGSGRTLANLIHYRDHFGLPVDIRVVVSSRRDVRGIEIARDDGIEVRVVRKADYPNPEDHSREMFDPCRQAEVDLVVMAGYLNHVLVPSDFENRVINIHPSLLPAFGGPGMYGNRVHQAILDRGVKVSGCTVHFVDNEYDNGPILVQRTCEVRSGDSADILAARVFREECIALPEAIRSIASSR